jgi:aspartate carbamoyltransferase regulatory subunit
LTQRTNKEQTQTSKQDARKTLIEISGGKTPYLLSILKDQTPYVRATVQWKDKDVLELPEELSEETLTKIKLLEPRALIYSVSEDGKAYEKTGILEEGKWIEGRIIYCPNKNCVTAQPKEPTRPKFKVVKKDPLILQCYYCGRYIDHSAIVAQIAPL